MLQTQRWAAHRGLQDSAYNTYNTEARENKKEQVKFIAQYVSQHNRYILKLNIPSFHTVLISLWQKLGFVKRLVCKHADSCYVIVIQSTVYFNIFHPNHMWQFLSSSGTLTGAQTDLCALQIRGDVLFWMGNVQTNTICSQFRFASFGISSDHFFFMNLKVTNTTKEFKSIYVA